MIRVWFTQQYWSSNSRKAGTLASLALFAIIMLAYFSCGVIQGSYSDGKPVALPADWPIQELTVIEGATRSKLEPMLRGTTKNDGYQVHHSFPDEQIWIVGFKTTTGWQAVREHTDGCLRQLRFLLTARQAPNNRAYISVDGLKTVHVAYDRLRRYYTLHVVVNIKPDWNELTGAKPL